jgi:pimeloyl-ACP methyl ester carboxylesterase
MNISIFTNRQLALIVFSFFFIQGCSSLPNSTKVRSQGNDIEFSSLGSNSPVLVFETGAGPTMSTWEPIFEPLSVSSRVFAYNRPGYARSSMDQVPQNISQVANQLKANLIKTGHTAPYVLIGHSYGGLIINAFARLYPNETKAVILLDATHPDQTDFFKEEHPFLYGILTTAMISSDAPYEMTLLNGARSEFKSLPSFPDVPLLVLTADEQSSIFESKEIRKQWILFQKDLASMSTRSTHLIIKGSGHFIHQDKPNIVIREIQKILME